MRRVILIFSIVILGLIVFFNFNGKNPKVDRVEEQRIVTQKLLKNSQKGKEGEKDYQNKQCVALPYWIKFDRGEVTSQINIMYFGIAFDDAGNILRDEGYERVGEILNLLFIEPKIIVRMVDKEQNRRLLKDDFLREKMKKSLLQFTTSNPGFRSVVLDLEFSPIFDEFYKEKISDFVKKLSESLVEQGIGFEVILFADTFYRNRPYDVKAIAQVADKIWLMAYDFTKPNSLPGPNFPLLGKQEFGYDLETAVEQFLQFVPKGKLGVIFGAYGYEWIVDEENRPLQRAKALTTKQINARYVANCKKECSLSLHPLAKEKVLVSSFTEFSKDFNANITRKRVIFYDDLESIEIKRNYLKKKGINSFCLWAYGYY